MNFQPARMWWTIGGPVVGLLTFTVVLALATGLLGWYPAEIWGVAIGLGVAVAAFAAFLLLRQGYERQAVATALHNVEVRAGGIVDSAMDPIVTVDDTQSIVRFNAAAERVFGWPRDAMIGQPLDRLIPGRFQPMHTEHIERFGATGTTSRRMGGRSALAALRASGEEFPIEASISQHVENGRKLFTVILRDITERMQAETLLARSEARLRGIVDSAMDAIITVDETQHVVMFNAAAEAMFGFPQDEAIGAPLTSFLPERFRVTHDAHVIRFGATGTSARRMGALRVVSGLRRNGAEFPIDASISQHTDGAHKFFTVILRDVTQRVEAERALVRSKEELQALALSAHQAREQEQNRIARELHDELGQSLTALRMMVVWIRERTDDGDAELSAKLARMGQLLNETVVAMRRISSELRPLILDDLGLVPAIEALVEQFTERTGIACELAVGDPALELEDAQKTAVFRIVQESLTNIVKHARATRAEVTIEQANGEITINVSDNGAGFVVNAPRGQQSRGLLGMRERAYLLRGEMTINSGLGNGTTLEVRLPTMGGRGARS
ncbi:MAG TPA: PAS domain S-box protein [Casimicrobiaceae bacterium]